MPPEYVEGEKPTEAMLRSSDHGKHALPAAELTAIMAMERAVEVSSWAKGLGDLSGLMRLGACRYLAVCLRPGL